MIDYVNGLVATGDYPQLAALADETGSRRAGTQIEAHLRDPDRFDRNLDRLLDGIEADLPDSRCLTPTRFRRSSARRVEQR